MRMSISTTSGRVRWQSSTPSRPFSASPTTSMSGWASRIMLKPSRISAWSSTIATLMVMMSAPVDPVSADVQSTAGRSVADDGQDGAHRVATAGSRS